MTAMTRYYRPVSALLAIAALLRAADSAPIIVQATKEPQPLDQTADPLDTWDGVGLADHGLADLRSLWARTPNVQTMSDRPDGMLSVRGVGFGERPAYGGDEDPTRGQQAPLGVYIDGVAVDAAGGLAAFDRLLDVERIELLRGPQGTLYGRGALAGVVDIRTRDPAQVWETDGRLYGGNDRTLRASAAVGGPLADGLGLRLAVGGGRSDGSLANATTGDDATDASRDRDLRAKLVWQPRPDLTVRLSGSLAARDGSTDYWVPQADADQRQSATDQPGDSRQRGGTLGLSATAALGDGTVLDATVGTAHAAGEVTYDADRSARALAAVDGDSGSRTLSGELRLRHGDPERTGLAWLAGVAAFAQCSDFSTSTAFSATPVANLMPPFFPPTLPYYAWVQQPEHYSKDSRTDALSLAVFGQCTWHPVREWGITAGLRLGSERQRFDWSQRQASSVAYPSAPDGTFTADGSRSETVALPKLAVTRHLGEDGLAWASVARGYRPGGFNSDATSATSAAITYDPEYTWNYELGLRLSDPSGGLSWRNAAFYTDWRQQQVFTNVSAYDVARVNASRSHVAGLESTLSAKPHPEFEVHGGIGLMRTAFDEREDPFNGTDYAGNRFALVPAYTWQVGAAWRHGSGLFAGADCHGQGKVYLRDDNQATAGAYALLDARVGYEGRQWSVALLGANLADRSYVLDAFELPADFAFTFVPTDYVRLGPARSLGLEISAWW